MYANELIKTVAFISSAIAMGVGSVGSSIGIGRIGAKDIAGSARNPEAEGPLLKTMLIAMAIASTTAMYALLVALLLLFVTGTL